MKYTHTKVKQVQSLFGEPGTWSTERTKDRVMCYENKTFYNTLFFLFSSDGSNPAGTSASSCVENSCFQQTLQDTKVKLCVLPLVQRLPPLCQLKGNDRMTMWTVMQLKQVNAPKIFKQS